MSDYDRQNTAHTKRPVNLLRSEAITSAKENKQRGLI